jgi:hypothetical protein
LLLGAALKPPAGFSSIFHQHGLRANCREGVGEAKVGNSMKDWIERLFRGRYVGLLEADVARLRAENRALTNSLLGTAGFPPLEFPEPPQPQSLPRLRKRSWHQLQAWREIGSNRDATLSSDDREEARANGPVSHS